MTKLDELTHEFLSSLPSHTHMSWSEWEKEANAYGLNKRQIAELHQSLETNKQLTIPVRFSGRQWWLTKLEIKHINLIKQHYPTNWEKEVLDRMQRGDLGYLDKDWRLKEKKKAKHYP